MLIEKNIPVPEQSGRGRRAKYPFSKMEVGDSVFFPGENSSSRCSIAAHAYGHRVGWKFSVRTMDGGVRIWRIT